MKTAKTTKAWIITGGTNTGVMRLVGDAVAEDLNAQDLTVLGIASWGCIAFKDKMVNDASENALAETLTSHQNVRVIDSQLIKKNIIFFHSKKACFLFSARKNNRRKKEIYSIESESFVVYSCRQRVIFSIWR